MEGIFTVSGLSLVLLNVLPLGGLTPTLGRAVILSIFGIVYGPNTVGSTSIYSLSPRVLIHSSRLLCLSLTWYLRFWSLAFAALQLFSMDLIEGNNSWGDTLWLCNQGYGF